MRIIALTALMAASLLAGCLAAVPDAGDSRIVVRDGAADGSHGACKVSASPHRIDLCRTVFSVTNGTFSVTGINTTLRLQWSDLTVETDPASTLRTDGLPHELHGPVALGTVFDGPVRRDQGFRLCAATATELAFHLTDTRRIGGDLRMPVLVPACSDAPLHHLDENVTLTVTEATTPFLYFFGGGYCYDLARSDGRMFGTVKATWTPQGPNAEALTVRTTGGSATGPSPLVAQVALDPDSEFSIHLEPPSPGAAAGQKVAVEIHVASESPIDDNSAQACW